MLGVDEFIFPGHQIPTFRSDQAIRKGVQNKILFKAVAGIGDQICAEPAIRFALENFRNVEISIATKVPEFFTHLKFKKVYDLKVETPKYEDYFTIQTYAPPGELVWDFVSHGLTHCIDHPSIMLLQGTLPIESKVLQLPTIELSESLLEYTKPNYVALHASKNWETSTFPAEWWNSIIDELVNKGFTPVLFGKEMNEKQGTVATKTEGCVDLRNKLSLLETSTLLQKMKHFICNDSSPFHMACPGNTYIAFVAAAKHQDFIYHWRKNLDGKAEWAWRMKHFNKGGMWELTDRCPNKEGSVFIDKVDKELLNTWLPKANEIVDWINKEKD